MAPLAPPTWVEPFDAIDKGIICPQFSVPAGKTAQEDCLVASVYVPNTNKTNLPVMIIIHGGQFLVGYGDVTTPRQLVNSQKVIVVTFNYRLGIHGFLCLGTKDVPGNAGMKDQVALLRWVKQNIASFGGNPDEVTIVGCSAGGSSVDLLMISKLTKGLFKRVIGMSSANVGVTSVQLDPVEYARTQARRNPAPEGSTALPRWPPANANRSPCMEFGQTVELKPTVIPLRATLWDLIYALFYRNPIPPTPGF
uniref:Carboxylic ester hydrolase n=1 Tax=Chilo suppressalis TaxID=168631 RepID=A0A0B4RY99_CHISP|nr:carboxyl/choline esterase [Chilo suppressalis]